MSAFLGGSADRYASPVSVPVGVCRCVVACVEEKGEGNSMHTVTLTKHLCFRDEATRTG